MAKIVDRLVWFRKRLLVRASFETMATLIPFLLVGVFSIVISSVFLSPRGFGADILHINSWVQDVPELQRIFIQLTAWTTGLLALFAAYKNAEYTTTLVGRRSRFAGLTGMISYILLLCLPTRTMPFAFQMEKSGTSADNGLFGIQGLLFGLLVGYFVGLIFLKFEKKTDNKSVRDSQVYQGLLPIFIVLILSVAVGELLQLLTKQGVFAAMTDAVQNYSSQRDGLLLTIVGSLITGALNWIGLSGPFDFNVDTSSSILASQNALYALKHGIWNIPYPFSQLSLYHSYATYGGVGATLALMIAIVIVSRNRRDLTTVKWGLFPALFNNNSILLLGLPIFFNIIYLIPFLLIPVVNMLIVALLITLHITPPVPYPVPIGTPGPLISLIGTGGNLAALVTGIFILVVDIFLYMPFVKLNARVDHAYLLTKEGVTDHERTH